MDMPPHGDQPGLGSNTVEIPWSLEPGDHEKRSLFVLRKGGEHQARGHTRADGCGIDSCPFLVDHDFERSVLEQLISFGPFSAMPWPSFGLLASGSAKGGPRVGDR